VPDREWGSHGASDPAEDDACGSIWWGDLQMWISMLLLGLAAFGLLWLFILACERL
jgi:hypothetical protein